MADARPFEDRDDLDLLGVSAVDVETYETLYEEKVCWPSCAQAPL